MAAWVEFSADWDHRPHPSQVVAYKKGQRLYLPQPIADEAIASGRAEVIHKPDDLKSLKTGGVAKVEPAPASAPDKQEN